MAWTVPENVTMTCPVCAQTVVANGQGSMNSSYIEGVLITTLTYTASVQHDCPGITAPEP